MLKSSRPCRVMQGESERDMIKCNSPHANWYERCVVDMDGLQSCGGTICCNTAEDMDFDQECILRHCEYAESEE